MTPAHVEVVRSTKNVAIRSMDKFNFCLRDKLRDFGAIRDIMDTLCKPKA